MVLVEIDHDDQNSLSSIPKVREAKIDMLARSVLAVVREMDLVSRYSSTCLAFLLPNAVLLDAVRVAERIRKTVERQPVSVGRTPLYFSVSVGVIEVNKTDDLVSLFRRAEAALDAGHLQGGNCICCHDGQDCKPAEWLLQHAGA